MKLRKIASLAALVMVLSAGVAHAGAGQVYREQSAAGMAMHKLGRGITNVLTCWVEIPRQIAMDWERTDPVTGLILGSVKGVGWGFARLATGVYDTVTFPFPVPEGYAPMMDPEFVVTDVWGDTIPALTEFNPNNPERPGSAPVYPNRFSF